MRSVKVVIVMILSLIAAACNPSSNNGAKFVGNWHTAPMSQNVTRQNFLEIKHETDNKYSVTGYWIMPGTSSGKNITIFTLKNGALSGPMNTTLIVNDKGTLISDGMEFTK